MDDAFSRTARSVRADGGAGWSMAAGGAAGLLLLWSVWMIAARVPVRAVSDTARIEAADRPRAVQAAVQGAVRSVEVALGDRVDAGAVLVRLDDTDAAAALADAQAHRAGVSAQLERLADARGALAGASALDGEARRAAAAAARADAEQGRVASAQADAEAARAEDLAARGAIGTAELQRARADARRLALEARARQLTYQQLTSQGRGPIAEARSRSSASSGRSPISRRRDSGPRPPSPPPRRCWPAT